MSASTKKKLRSTERAEKLTQKQLEEQNAALLRESGGAKHKAKFLGMGYEVALATDAATAMVDGDMEKLFTYQQKHQEALEKKIRADALKSTPKPVPNKDGGPVTRDQVAKMSMEDRIKFYQEHPDEYKELYGG